MMEQRQLILVLLGPPGAGKGTQAALLSKAYHLLHISTGDMLRERVKQNSGIGRDIQGYMARGELVPDGIVTQAVIDRMGEPDAASGVILDGYPRTRVQAGSLDDSLKKANRFLDIVLYFRTSEDVAVQRLSGRRVCPKCGKNYHIVNIRPKKEGICDTCGVELIQREDDRPETVKKRFSVYEQRTEDLIMYYEGKGSLREVDGNLPAGQLFDAIDVLFRREGLTDDAFDK